VISAVGRIDRVAARTGRTSGRRSPARHPRPRPGSQGGGEVDQLTPRVLIRQPSQGRNLPRGLPLSRRLLIGSKFEFGPRPVWSYGDSNPRPLECHGTRTVHRYTRQVTRDGSDLGIRSERVTSVHRSSPRTATNLVTSRVVEKHQFSKGNTPSTLPGLSLAGHSMQRGAAVRPPSRLADPLSCGTGAVRDPGSTGSGPASAGTECTPGATFTAEVSLAGSLRPVRGVLSANGHRSPVTDPRPGSTRET
jgi:hypothetical protein